MVILRGDFKQILPVFTKGSGVDIVTPSISKATFWFIVMFNVLEPTCDSCIQF